MRTTEQIVADFVAANDKHSVIMGVAKDQGGCGGRYKLSDGTWYDLSLKACQLLPEGYPKWGIPD